MKRVYYFIFIVFSLFFSVGVRAQVQSDESPGRGDVVVHTDPRLSLLLKKNHAPIASSARLSTHKSQVADFPSERRSPIHPSEGMTAPHPGEIAMHTTTPAKPVASIKPEPAVAAVTKSAPVYKADPPIATPKPVPVVKTESPIEWAPKYHVRTIYSGKGYRVQIYNGPDRARAMDIKNEFSRNNPGVRTYLCYISPCFRVKVGNYRNRSDAVGMWREANSTYNPSMIVPDIITITTLE